MYNREDVRKIIIAYQTVINTYTNKQILKEDVLLKQLCEDILKEVNKEEILKVKK